MIFFVIVFLFQCVLLWLGKLVFVVFEHFSSHNILISIFTQTPTVLFLITIYIFFVSFQRKLRDGERCVAIALGMPKSIIRDKVRNLLCLIHSCEKQYLLLLLLCRLLNFKQRTRKLTRFFYYIFYFL